MYNFARRGRSDSGDTSPYAVQREIDDIAALIAEAGGSAHLFGASSGGMFALEAAAAGLPIGRVAVYEVPYDAADDALQRARHYRAQLRVALVEGRRADAVGLFMRLAGSSEKDIADAVNSPYWSGLKDLAYTLAYDAALYGPPPTNRLARITQPVLIATGGTTTTSSRLRTRSQPALRMRSARSSKARATWLIRRSWLPCSPDSSDPDSWLRSPHDR